MPLPSLSMPPPPLRRRRCSRHLSSMRTRCLLTLVVALALASVAAEMHLMDEDEVSELDADEKSDMAKHEIENCVPYNIRSFTLGARAVVEWATRRTYIRKVHRTKAPKATTAAADATAVASPWQSCSDASSVEVRYRRIGDMGAFTHVPATTYVGAQDNATTHTAWLELPVAHSQQGLVEVTSFEFIVGSMFHGWSSSHRIGDSGFVRSTDEERCRPKQVHTAYGQSPDSFAIQWLTHDACSDGEWHVKLARGYHARIEESTPVVAVATTTLFNDVGDKQQTQPWHHVAIVSGLATATQHTYVVGNAAYAYSIPFTFKTAPTAAEALATKPMRFLVTGDIGYQNAATLPMMQSEVADGVVDAVVSMGDYAYDLHLAHGHVGDIFMEEIEPIAASVPFMVAPGNHEAKDAFVHYTERFRLMPANAGVVVAGSKRALRGSSAIAAAEAPNSWFYSVDVGLVHFVFVSTELFFTKKLVASNMVERQAKWLAADLALANTRRTSQPWIIVLGHRPMYCTSDTTNCGHKAAVVRDHLEELFYDYGVDLYVCGHQHNYERAFDVYKSHTAQRTTNMRATTHILTGAAGQYELAIMRKAFELPPAAWDAFRNSIFGYSRLDVHNATHIRWQQVESDPENPAAQGLYGQVVDDVWLVQEQHGSFRTREVGGDADANAK